MVEVKLENLTKKFGKSTAVDDLNLIIKDKEFFVLLGPSGSGKSTALNMIARLEEPTSGHVYFDGEIMDRIPTEKRDIAMVFQTYALYPHLNAFDNIAFGLRNRKVSEPEIKKRVEETAAMLGVGHLLKRKPFELSGGERQRIALARAIVRKPKAFLLDEPLSNIDAKLRAEMRIELIRLHRALQITMIYVTHDQVEAMTMADKIAILDHGKLMQIDSPIKIYQEPANQFVAGFIGSPMMNFLDCELVEKDGKKILQSEILAVEVPRKFQKILKDIPNGIELILGVRPENMTVNPSAPSNEAVEGEVYALEHLGKETIADLKIGDKIVKAIVKPDSGLKLRDTAWIEIDRDELHLFDKKTGISLLRS